jgi:hypothetical protein
MPVTEKVPFALDIEDGWPQVATEHVWCEREGDTYTLKNVPFFIPGLALGDVFRAERDPGNDCIFEFEVLQPSGHSVVWVMNNDDLDFSQARKQLAELGCESESFPQFSMFSVDVPAGVGCAEINAMVDSLEKNGFALAFPVWRHDPVA